MDEFLAALRPSLRGEVQAALDQDETARARLTAVASAYIDEDGRWPTDAATADVLARTFLHQHTTYTSARYSGSGLKETTLAGLVGGAVAVGGAKGATVLGSKVMSNYWQDIASYSTGLNPALLQVVKKVVDQVTEGTRWEQVAKDLSGPEGPSAFQTVFRDGYAGTLNKELMGTLKRAAWRGARSAVNHFDGTIGDVSEENVWVDNYVRKFSQNQADLAERTMRQVITSSLERGYTPGMTAQRLRELWALSPRHAQAVENYRRGLEKQKRSRLSINELSRRYANKLLDFRLRSLSQTETHTVFNLGREAQWVQAVANGDMPLDTEKMWVTAQDELVCEICRPMDGVTAPLGSTFEGTVNLMVPSAHPNCRCIVIPVQVGVADFSKTRMVLPPKEAVAKHLGGSSGKDPHPSGTPQEVHAGFDEAISELKSGAYAMPMSWLTQHVRGSGIRIGQRNRVRNLANHLLEDGFTKPITMWVYEDGPFIRDGMHRLEAAHLIGLDRVPVAIQHVEGNRPKTDVRGRLKARKIRQQGPQPRRDTPFRNAKQEGRFVNWFNEKMSERGETAAQAPERPERKRRFTLFSKAEGPVLWTDESEISKKKVWVKEHTRSDGTNVEGHWRNLDLSSEFQGVLDQFSGPVFSQSGDPLTIYESAALLAGGVATTALFRQAIPLTSVKSIANPVQALKANGNYLAGMMTWVGGGSMRFRVFLEGNRTGAASTRQWTAFADGLDQLAKRKTPLQLHRGMTVAASKAKKVDIESFTLTADDLRVGHTFDMAPSSFTRSKRIASDFTKGGSTKHGARRVVLHVDRGSNSARIADVSPMPWEREYVGWGTYKINSVVPNSKGWTDVWVNQVQTYSLGHLARNPPRKPSVPSRSPSPQQLPQMNTDFLEALIQGATPPAGLG